jgi:hypothetical protein
MKSLGILNCFFGEWPEWGDLFVETCRHNPTVEFFLVSDCAAPRQGFPANVRWVKLDFAEFRALAAERLGFAAALPKPYKLIDFKPAWGVILREYVESYDFWGYCDLDVILGDIRAFLTEELLARYDVVSCRREFLSGHFMLFRNTEEINHLFEESRDYRRILTSETVWNFDECGHGLHPKLLRGAAFAEVAGEAKIDSMMHVLARRPEIRVHYETICGEQVFLLLGGNADKELRILADRGKVVDLVAGQERMYFHLQFLKLERRVFVPRWKEIPPAFLLTRRGVFWRGEQPLGQRLTSAVQRAFYFVLVRPVRVAPLTLKWGLFRLLRALAPLRRLVVRPAAG